MAENIFLGRERGGRSSGAATMLRAVQQLLDDLGVRVTRRAPVRGLSVAQQQMVEIARALVDRRAAS